MATTSARAIWLAFTETLPWKGVFRAASNAASPNVSETKTLAAGFNLITPPADTVATGVTIVPPSYNELTITLKGITGDTGLLLNPSDPTSLGLGSPTATFGLTAEDEIEGVRFVWS